MRSLSPDAFLQWAGDRGIGRDAQFPDSEHLVFTGLSGDSRYWEYPQEASIIPLFIDTLLIAVGRRQRFWLYPGHGYWSLGGPSESWPQTQIWKASIHGLGVPMGLVGAVGIDAAQGDVLEALLFLQVTLGPSVYVDMIAIPEDGHFVLYFEHHKVVHVSFRDRVRLQTSVGVLAGAGFPLPAEAPDGTFKQEPWMQPDSGHDDEGA
jgi:hypothetical protein